MPDIPAINFGAIGKNDQPLVDRMKTFHNDMGTTGRPPALPKETGTMTVTPDEAFEWLKRQSGNRKLRLVRIKLYAEQMKAGQWVLNGETIAFSKSGRLLNGQHRLWACLLSDKSFPCIIAINVPDDAFATIDTGLGRKPADVLDLEGKANAVWLAQAARLAMLWERSPRKRMADRWDAVKATTSALTNPVIAGFVADHPEYEKIAERVKKLNLHKLMPPSVAIFGWVQMRAMDAKKADAFIDQLASGEGLRRGDPLLTLRDDLAIRTMRSWRAREVLARLIKAWNAHYYEKSLSALRFREDGWYPNFGDQDELRDLPQRASDHGPRSGNVRVVEEQLV